MNKAIQTFGDYLLQFGLTIDIVDDITFNDFMEIVDDYVSNYLKIDFISLKIKNIIDNNVGLHAVKGYDEKKTITIKNNTGEITGQTAYAFVKKIALWITDKNKKDLKDDSAQHVDLWNKQTDFPQVGKHKNLKVKTSIIVPIIRDNEAVGVVKYELEKIADTISRVQYLYRSFEAQHKNTHKAINRLRSNLSNISWPELTKPQIFVAFPAMGEPDVIGEMKSVLDSFKERANVMFWDHCSDSGKVDQQIIEAIAKSKFGVCYFSEPMPEGSEYKYFDNPNVIFEAGMFQALTNSPGEKPIGWVPIREKESPPPPFDYGSDRILLVERLNNNSLNTQIFVSHLNKRISNLLDKLEP
jgi:hypothetical protein